jgi:hypothetical protein
VWGDNQSIRITVAKADAKISADCLGLFQLCEIAILVCHSFTADGTQKKVLGGASIALLPGNGASVSVECAEKAETPTKTVKDNAEVTEPPVDALSVGSDLFDPGRDLF